MDIQDFPLCCGVDILFDLTPPYGGNKDWFLNRFPIVLEDRVEENPGFDLDDEEFYFEPNLIVILNGPQKKAFGTQVRKAGFKLIHTFKNYNHTRQNPLYLYFREGRVLDES